MPADYLYIPAKHHGGHQSTIKWITIHRTESTLKLGGARQVARYFQTTTRPASAHYVVGPDEVIRCLPDNVIAYHAPPNANTLGIELLGYTKDNDWSSTLGLQMLTLAGHLARQLCALHSIPAVYVPAAGLRTGKRGITTHKDVSVAFRQSTHTDPGPYFPMDSFIQMIANTTPTEEEMIPVIYTDDTNSYQFIYYPSVGRMAPVPNDDIINTLVNDNMLRHGHKCSPAEQIGFVELSRANGGWVPPPAVG